MLKDKIEAEINRIHAGPLWPAADRPAIVARIEALKWVLEQLEIDRRKADPSQG